MKHPLATLLVTILLSACSDKTNIIINGEIKEGAKTRVRLERIEGAATRAVDSTRLDARGRFSFARHDTVPTFYALAFSNDERVTLVASPGDTLTVTGTLAGLHDNYWVEGSEDALWIKLLDFQMSRTLAAIDSLKRARDSIPADERFNHRRETVEHAYRETLEKQVKFSRDFILAHAISPAAYYALYQRVTPSLAVLDEIADQQSFKIVASSMNALYPGSPYTIALMNHLKEIAKIIRGRQLVDLVNNAPTSLPAIRLPDITGKIIALDDIKSKLVILDFNLLGTRESAGNIRELQRLHDKYRDRGVEIYQVCLDANRLLWEEMVKRFAIKWTCVRDEEALQSRVAASWNIKEIPANYIINNKQEIVGKNLRGRRLEERVEELLAR